jgi:hypothetical protein
MSSAPRIPAEAFKAMAEADLPCLICGSPHAPNVAAFVPTSAEAKFVAGPPAAGKQRVLIYRACNRCLGDAARDPDRFERLLLQAVSSSRERQ